MLALVLVLTAILCALAYHFYGAFLEKSCQIDPRRETPACKLNDGVDFVPTRAGVLFGHHFSSIAGAGPIVGPVLAAAAFGWAPTWIWIVIGAIFVGGVHDFGSTVMSVRYQGRSIADTCRKLVGETTGKLFMLFVLFALLYVIIVFLDITAAGFAQDGAVATSSGWFVIAAVTFGFVINKTKVPFAMAVPVFILLTYAGLWVGHEFKFEALDKNGFLLLIGVYCYVAAILPVNVLMQPRDFLSSTFLIAIMVLGMLGLFFAGESFQIPAFMPFDSAQLGMMVPFLFITVACGACSGFHSIVSSGTTSKQISSEGDIRKVAYGGMLVEGVLATFALACVAVLGGMQGSPVATFSQGAAVFFNALGIPQDFGASFALLAVSTFLLTTLDTTTRLTRFIIEELTGHRNDLTRFGGTLFVVLVPTLFAFQTYPDASGTPIPVWKAIWPLFGSTNQLLAALALVTFTVFLKTRRRAFGFALIPAAAMVFMPMLALSIMTWRYAKQFFEGGQAMNAVLAAISGGMFVLGLIVVIMSMRRVFGADTVFVDDSLEGGTEAA